MEIVVSQLLKKFEDGRISRRELIQSLAALALAGSGAPAAAQVSGFKTARLDHISYQAGDYRRTRDFFAKLMGMPVDGDDGKRYCQLLFGETHRAGARARSFIGVNTSAANGQSPGAPGTIDHLAFTIEDWNTDRVKAELERRGLKPRLQAGGPGDTPNYVSFHVQDPDGLGIQISGIARPGDSAYKKT
jgi:catechol 2,3-dioxygenase-like lactoylglutathione lyase family enzyme